MLPGIPKQILGHEVRTYVRLFFVLVSTMILQHKPKIRHLLYVLRLYVALMLTAILVLIVNDPCLQ